MLRVTRNLGQSKLYGDFEPFIFVHQGNEEDSEYIPLGVFETEQEARKAINKYMEYLSEVHTLEELRRDMHQYD